MDLELRPREVEIIKRLDALYRNDRLHPVELEPPGAVKNVFMGLVDRQKGKS